MVTALRRRYRWAEIASMARSAGGVWRLHPDLAAVTPHLLRHAQRRVPSLYPRGGHVYEFARGNEAVNDRGETVFDLYVRVRYYTPEEKEAIKRGDLDPRHLL